MLKTRVVSLLHSKAITTLLHFTLPSTQVKLQSKYLVFLTALIIFNTTL